MQAGTNSVITLRMRAVLEKHMSENYRRKQLMGTLTGSRLCGEKPLLRLHFLKVGRSAESGQTITAVCTSLMV